MRPRVAVAAIAAGALLTCPLSAAPADPAGETFRTLVAEPLVVLLDGGTGSATLVCSIEAVPGAPPPAPPVVTITDAVGTRDAVPASAFAFAWDPPDPKLPSLLRGRLAVPRPVSVEPSVEYKGTLVVGGVSGAAGRIAFTAVDRKPLAFEVESEKQELVYGVGQALAFPVRVKNTGHVSITSVEAATLGLVDGTRRLVFSQAVTTAVRPSREATVSVAIPAPTFAGTYTGSVRFTANGGAEGRSVPLTVRARGPNRIPRTSASLPFLPGLLFALVVVAGVYMSTRLDAWFGEGGGLARADATLALQGIARRLDRARAEITSSATLRVRGVWIESQWDEISRALVESRETPIKDLTAQAERFRLPAAQAETLVSAVGYAKAHWSSTEVDAVLAELDAVPLAEPAAYGEALRVVLASAGRAKAARGLQAAPEPPTKLAPPTEEQLKAEKKNMGALYRVAGFLVVLFTAYFSFYAKNPAFGTFADYVAVFLWALGLTQTGKKIVQVQK